MKGVITVTDLMGGRLSLKLVVIFLGVQVLNLGRQVCFNDFRVLLSRRRLTLIASRLNPLLVLLLL